MTTVTTHKRSYKELMKIPSFTERLEYLRLQSVAFKPTFGSHRYLNQVLYTSKEWKQFRNKIIIRDNGFDLAHEDYPIRYEIYIHHINPLTEEDVVTKSNSIFDPDNVVCTSFDTHEIIHFGRKDSQSRRVYVERRPNDTCLWR